jgi:bifunctional DNA-binding transcriptional regulator/antitoxin component of YhaV-PrlF toxin-antitoxin module
MKDNIKGEGEEGALKTLHFFAFLDSKGRLIIPTRDRKEAGLMGQAADVECVMTVLKTYKEGAEK